MNRLILLAVILLFQISSSSGQNWAMRSTIQGDSAGDLLGESIALSSDGNTMAVGIPGSDVDSANSGEVRVLNWNGSAWVQKGNAVYGSTRGDLSGYAVSINADGNRIAIGTWYSYTEGEPAGQVRVFTWKDTTWLQMGQSLTGNADNEGFGWSLELSSSGNRMIVGVPGAGSNSTGAARIFEWKDSLWEQIGSDIPGDQIYDQFGMSVSISGDGRVVSASSSINSSGSKRAGQVKIFQWAINDWYQMGSDITGAISYEYAGSSTGLNKDGSRLIVGAPGSLSSTKYKGRVRVYRWIGTAWLQQGSDVISAYDDDQFGVSSAISQDGQTIVVGSPQNDQHYKNSGQVNTYRWSGVNWLPFGRALQGASQDEEFGRTVALNSVGDVVAGSSSYASTNGTNTGLVVTFEICHPVRDTLNVMTNCLYVAPSGKELGQSGQYLDTIINETGCDTIIQVNLTLGKEELVTTDPADQSVNAGDTVFFIVGGMARSYQWQCDTGTGYFNLVNNGIFNGVNNDTLILLGVPVQLSGAIFRCVVSNGSCSDTSLGSLLQVEPVGTGQVIGPDHVTIYPNPAFSVLFVRYEHPGDKTTVQITIFNSLGEPVISKSGIRHGLTEIDLKELNAGFYSMHYQVLGGAEYIHKLIVY